MPSERLAWEKAHFRMAHIVFFKWRKTIPTLFKHDCRIMTKRTSCTSTRRKLNYHKYAILTACA